MKNVDMERVVIPVSQIDHAQKALNDHIMVLHRDAKWLKRHDYPATSIFFFILCMEEIAKSYVIAECKGDDRDVTKKDMQRLYSHPDKIKIFLEKTSGVLDELMHPKTLPATMMDYGQISKKLDYTKQRAVYYEYNDGNAATLESIWGSDVSHVALLLQKATKQGICAINAHLELKPVSNMTQMISQDTDDFHTILDQVMDYAQALQVGNAPDADIAIPKEVFDTVLPSLENHIGDLDEVAAKLHASQHLEASIFMSIMCLEEGAKYYLIAKCRRQKCDVSSERLKDLENHEDKLGEFFKDVSRALGKRNMPDKSNPPKYLLLHPKAFLKLNGVKQLALYFNYLDNTTLSLKGILGYKMADISHHLRILIQGLTSWMITCDGNSKDPYACYSKNPVHRQRYDRFDGYMTHPKTRETVDDNYYLMGLLNYLNRAARKYNTSHCNVILSEIRKYFGDRQSY